jgi:D-serine deaminase-like pyridoxal phosphate-dependent protein
MADDRATIDRRAVDALAEERVDWRHKSMPPALWGKTVGEIGSERPGLSDLATPLLTLSRSELDHNRSVFADWCASRGLLLAPHGKTTMAPSLWAEQIEAGAWGITVATFPQLAVARAFGVSRTLVANALVTPLALRWVADELARCPGTSILVWADSVRTVALMESVLDRHTREAGARPPVEVLVELGAPGGRTGARDLDTAREVARAVASSRRLSLAGLAGYEGALAHGADERSRRVVRTYLEALAELHADLLGAGLYAEPEAPVVSAGGSAHFDLVADVLGPLVTFGARVVLRSGAYLVHDDGFYRGASPLGAQPRTDGPALRSAMHGWARVTSQPEPGLALADAGKRDLPFDEGLPEAQLRRPRAAGDPVATLPGVAVTALNDQHAFLAFDPAVGAPVQVGDVVRLGLSHPCTAFDKWTLIPVVDDAAAPEPTVVDLVRTWF